MITALVGLFRTDNLIVLSIPTTALIIILGFYYFVPASLGRKYKFLLLTIILALTFFNGLFYVFRTPYWDMIDEGSHFNYIQYISEHKKLPLLSDYSSPQVLAIGQKTYPGAPLVSAKNFGLGGRQYEAFQPPLYYLLSVPVYRLAGSNFIYKIFALRIFGLLQLILLLYILYQIFDWFRESLGFSDSLVFVPLVLIGLNPAFIVRAVTVGNSILPVAFISLVALCILGMFKAENVSNRLLFWASIFTALALLTRFTSIFIIPVVIFALFLVDFRSILRNTLIFCGIVLILMSPWLIFNKIHYGSFTANKQSQVLQQPVVNPGNITYGLHYVENQTPAMFDRLWIPEEIGQIATNQTGLMIINRIWSVINIVLAIGFLSSVVYYLPLWRKKNFTVVYPYLVVGSMLVLLILQQIYGTLSANWPILIGRYLHPAVISFGFLYLFPLVFLYKKQREYKWLNFSAFSALVVIPVILNLAFLFSTVR